MWLWLCVAVCGCGSVPVGVYVRLCVCVTPTCDVSPPQLADVFCPNETEAALITGLPTETDDEIVVAARALLRRGARSVLMTLGERGVLLVGGDDAEQTIHIPGRDVQAIDTSGAGDSFLGSFSAFLALGLDAPEAMRRAVYVAGESVQGRGTQASFKGRAELPESLFA